MKIKLFRNFKGYEPFYQRMTERGCHPTSKLYLLNMVEHIHTNKIKRNSVDIVITSPPYGDSHTTVAYGQYYRLSSELIGILKDNVNSMSMGGKRIQFSTQFCCNSLDDAISEVKKVNSKRAMTPSSMNCADTGRQIKSGNLASQHAMSCAVCTGESLSDPPFACTGIA